MGRTVTKKLRLATDAVYCKFDLLDDYDWERLLEDQPQFANKRK